ncbi:hypothetical protein EPN52_12245 [bacterium]|nr:MAG: hypothetical protein EPN52_12245 [bacterium]
MSYLLQRKCAGPDGGERWEIVEEFPSLQAANGMKGHLIGKGGQGELRVVPAPPPSALFAVGRDGRDLAQGSEPECYVYAPLGDSAREFQHWLRRPTEGELLARAWLKGVPSERLKAPGSSRPGLTGPR